MQKDKKQFLQDKIKENLYEFFAKDFESARDSEIYMAISKTLRLLIGKNWYNSLVDGRKNKTLYILSFEYSLGTRLVTNAIKLDIIDELKEILQENNKDFEKIANQELESALGFGDLGRVSADILDSLSSLGVSCHAYGLRYRKGMLKQEIINGEQIEKPDDWEVYKNPWEHEKGFYHKVKYKDYNLKAIPYDVPIVGSKNNHVNTLRLWKSESFEDIDFNLFSQGKIQESYKNINNANSVVEFLYPQEDSYEGRKLRLSQEYFFASASIQDIIKKYRKYHGDNIEEFTEKVSILINDVHPVLSMVILLDQINKKFGIDLDKALEICQKSIIFSNTSLIEESFEKWDISMINEVCSELIPIIKFLDKRLKESLKKENASQEHTSYLSIIRDSYIEMINIAFFMSNRVFIPTSQHIKVLKNIYLPYHYKYYNHKISLIKLGYNACENLQEINKELYDTFSEFISEDKNEINENLNLDLNQVKAIKHKNKVELMKFLNLDRELINPKSIFVMNLGIIHEYKRQLLGALGIAFLYYRLKQNGNLDIPERTYFFGGKSYPNYYFAKEVIKFINALSKLINNDFSIRDKIKIVFIENYNVKKSNKLIPAADVYEHLDVITKGTSSIDMFKFMSNGAITISSDVGLIHDYKLDKDSDSVHTFGPNETDAINRTLHGAGNIYDFLNSNRIIKDMFDFYKYLPFPTFSYDINVILNNLLKYNDSYNVLRDLLDYVHVHEKLMKEYRSQDIWLKNSFNSMHYALNQSMNEAVKSNIEKYRS